MDWPADLTPGTPAAQIALRMLLAATLGALFGWDREARNKPAGLRTHMLVSAGSATFTLLGIETVAVFSRQHNESISLDPTRIVEGIVGGLGFLGAGSIVVRGRTNEDVRGLTTAASIWFTGALGVAAGIGAFVLAIVAAAVGLVVLVVLGRVFKSEAEEASPRTSQDPKRER